jgi:hypothetical protein
MPATTRAPQSRPPGAPYYYLGRPASWWITALRPHQRPTHRAATGPAGAAPIRRAAG